MKGALATRVAGSADLYNTNGRKPYHSVNFVIAHDGFSLYDLVAYNSKHNEVGGAGQGRAEGEGRGALPRGDVEGVVGVELGSRCGGRCASVPGVCQSF